ncbi:MAG: hypothetical protein C0467_31145 [Planctomycetaceae bacterium]|nr:hypothetical protein [Planctomycetaceae bacterium]
MLKLTPLVALLIYLATTPTCAVDPPKEKGPDIGIDYRTFFNTHMKLVAEGKGEQAIESVSAHFNGTGLTQEFTEALRKRFATIYGAAGKCTGHEVVGYKQITSRTIRFYSVSHFDKFAITYSYLFIKASDDRWKLAVYSVQDGVDELEKTTALNPL